MTTDMMLKRVTDWIIDRTRAPEESLEIAENIRDLCEEWIDALRNDLDQ